MPEQYLQLSSGNHQLSAILHSVIDSATTKNTKSEDIGVLIIVGGPQYRVGSHRQFIKLSRYLATKQIPSLRLDSSGMGDSSGTKAMFYQQTADINAAITAMFQQLPHLKQVVLWGLCDAASAILLKMNQPDPRIAGLILLNPWVRQEQSHAETMLKHYYLKRLISREFWRKVLSGGLAFKRTFSDLRQTWRSSKQQSTLDSKLSSAGKPELESVNKQHNIEFTATNYVEFMLKGWQTSGLKTLVIISGNDLTAQEFLHLCQQDKQWQRCFNSAKQLHIADANHTFSTAQWRNEVEQACSDFVLTLNR